MKIVKKILVILVILGLVGAGVYYYMQPEEIEVVVADTGSVSPKLTMTGNVEGNELLTVYADVSGRVTHKYVKTGERVKTGDMLLSRMILRNSPWMWLRPI